MIDRIIENSIRHRWLALAAGVALAVWGAVAVYQTPMDAIPDLSETQVIVFTDWPGHNPQQIEDAITRHLSVHLQGMAGVETVRSSSDFNFSMIHVIFKDGVDMATARREVQDRLPHAKKELPSDANTYLAPDAPATGQIFWYTVEGPGYDLAELRTIQDEIVKHQLTTVPGVAEVASVGGHVLEYQISVDPLRLAALGITLGQFLEQVAEVNSTVGGSAVELGASEYLVRSSSLLPSEGDGEQSARQGALYRLENLLVRLPGQSAVPLRQLARVSLAPAPRRGVLEMDGNEVTGGVVLMRHGENPLEVTRRIHEKIQQLQSSLPAGIRIVPGYDRTPLIRGAVFTVASTVTEAMITAAICVLLVLLHVRASLVITLTLPLAVLGSFVLMWLLRRMGVADIQTNIMSLAGLAISIGVLVDSSIVMAENVMHELHRRFGNQPVQGDVREIVLKACRTVGRPIFFSILIMLLSFLPVFALQGLEGKMFRPLAFTKSFALLTVAVLSVTLVPAMCTIFIRGRVRGEQDSWIVRSCIHVYRPVLSWLLDHPAAVVWFMGVTFVVGFAPLGNRALSLATTGFGLIAVAIVARPGVRRAAGMVGFVALSLAAERVIQPLESEFITPLDEGTVMDMPITIPRVTIRQAADDLKARDMVLCRFPEVDMVMGKAGRAETPTDPAPIDMIETMVSFRPREFWPKRKLRPQDAQWLTQATLAALIERRFVSPPSDKRGRDALVEQSAAVCLAHFDALMREYTFQRTGEHARDLGHMLVRFTVEAVVEHLQGEGKLNRTLAAGDVALLVTSVDADLARRLAAGPQPSDISGVATQVSAAMARRGWLDPDPSTPARAPRMSPLAWIRDWLPPPTTADFSAVYQRVLVEHDELWRRRVAELDGELIGRAAETYTRLALEDLLAQAQTRDKQLVAAIEHRRRLRTAPPKAARQSHHGMPVIPMPVVDPLPAVDTLQAELTATFARKLLLWRKQRADLIGFGGEMDQALQMPGWTNVWTMPIQNRVDMLATGVNTTVGVRVLGTKLDDVVRASEEIASALTRVAGAVNVVADPIRGKGYATIEVDHQKAAERGVSVGELNQIVQTALGGVVATNIVQGRQRRAVRVRLDGAWREDLAAIRRLPLPSYLAARSDAMAASGRERTTTDHELPIELARLDRCALLGEVADVRIEQGPATIKGENGLLRNYVRLNVRDRDLLAFVEEAKRVVAQEVQLLPGVLVEWTGQFENLVQARRTLAVVIPIVVILILLILYATYRDLADAVLMLLAVPGAMAGGLLMQWLFGFKFSVTVMIGYIACFGMATATGIIMLVYLRGAVESAGGLERLSLDELRQAVMNGAVHRLRPKLLTEATTIFGLAPMLWHQGIGAEVIRPMAAPVLGGILIADEVIDLFLPVMFFWVRRWRLERLATRSGNGASTIPASSGATGSGATGSASASSSHRWTHSALAEPVALPRTVVCGIIACALLTGCGRATVESYVPRDDLARSALEMALDTWKAGKASGSVGKLADGGPDVQAVDIDWREGKKLAGFEILRELPKESGQPRQFAVRLILSRGAPPKEVNYFIVGKDPLWVFRDVDYAKTSGM